MKAIDEKSTGRNNIILFVVLQIMNVIFSLDSVLIKCASVSWENKGLFSVNTIALLGLAIAVLAIYAVIWQMILGHVKLAVAYLSKGLVVFWGLLWSVIFFQEQITWLNFVGTAFIFAGTILVNEHE